MGLVTTPTLCWGFGIGLVAGDHAAFPASDPDGLQLALTVEAAAQHYGAVFRDPWRIDVEFRYAPPGSLARAAIATPGPFIEYDPIGQPGMKRLVQGTILFNPDVNWFFDPTPLDHDEFPLEQTLVRDYSPLELGSWFEGTGPEMLEIGFGGRSHEIDGLDALTIALHELGHLMGVTNVRPQLDDFDFDLAPEFVHGGTLAVKASASRDHLRAAGTLMGTSLSPGERRLPSMTDLFAMAATAGWQEIDLPRKEFWGGGEWNTPLNWAGNRLPDLGDDVFVRAGNSVSLAGEAVAGRLFLTEGASLSVGGHRLQVRELHLGQNARLILGGSSAASGERLSMDASATLSATIGGSGAGSANIFFEGVQLAGTLELHSDIPQAPTAGTSRPLLLTPIIEGSFDRVALAGESAWEGMNVLLATETIGGLFTQLSAQVVITGDTNADGRVDQADLDAVLLGWGQHVAAAWHGSGDLDGNGLIDQGDLDRVLANWGSSVDHVGTSTVAVPEPASALLALAGVVAVFFFHRVRRPPPGRFVSVATAA